jgi:hypothetical protein
MGPLLLVALVAFAAWLGWRAFIRERDRVAGELRDQTRKPPPATTLERDPKTGVYQAPEDRS